MDPDSIEKLRKLFNEMSADKSVRSTMATGGPGFVLCNNRQDSSNTFTGDWEKSTGSATLFYGIITPLIFLIGVTGNCLCLVVFSAKRLRKTSSSSCSYCLGALSCSDLLVLLTYVAVEWLQRGLPALRGLSDTLNVVDRPGVCQAYLYLTYILRMNSVWLLVLFTVERYIGVCKPLHRSILCTPRRIKCAIASILSCAIVICSYKPIISGTENGKCGSPQDNSFRGRVGFVLDTMYALLLTAVPSVVIITLNILIARKLVPQRFALKRTAGPHLIGLQFGVTLIAISSCFVILNLPFFVVWSLMWADSIKLHSARPPLELTTNQTLPTDLLPTIQISCTQTMSVQHSSELDNYRRLSAILSVTRAVFHLNYCINFFLYSLTGAFFRLELRRLFKCSGGDYTSVSNCERQTYSLALMRKSVVSMTCINTNQQNVLLAVSNENIHAFTRSHSGTF